jgi:hypothetical protein
MSIYPTWRLLLALLLIGGSVGCTARTTPAPGDFSVPTLAANFLPSESQATQTAQLESEIAEPAEPGQIESQVTQTTGSEVGSPEPPRPSPTPQARPTRVEGSLLVEVDPHTNNGPISPLIYGLSGGEGAEFQSLGSTFHSWGGNPSTRYNWKLGNAWNAARDWYYRNGSYDNPDGVSVADEFLQGSHSRGIATRLAVPTLGWVAKDTTSCSFPQPDGSCGDADGATCQQPGDIANPETASVLSDPDAIAAWIQHLKDRDILPTYVAMDNEPELWGYTHYDVHPECTSYEEVLQKYLTYAEAIRSVAPQVKLAGPVACCWFSYWRTAPGPANPGPDDPQDYIAWFLQSVRRHDEASGQRSLDALDVHFYPQVGVYNQNIDPQTSALRLRSTRALWDPEYVDESWISEPIYFIPRMQQLIDQYYPGTQLGISEWNWGADESINGALAIADVLGIFGREGVTYAAYWRNPPAASPGFYAFKLYTNYDGNGGSFVGDSVRAESSSLDQLSSYAAYDPQAGQLKLILINKQPEQSAEIQVNLNNFTPASPAALYRYDAANLQGIQATTLPIESPFFQLSLPPYSLTLLVISGE